MMTVIPFSTVKNTSDIKEGVFYFTYFRVNAGLSAHGQPFQACVFEMKGGKKRMVKCIINRGSRALDEFCTYALSLLTNKKYCPVYLKEMKRSLNGVKINF